MTVGHWLIKGTVDKLIKPACTASYAATGLYGGPQHAHSWGDWIAAYCASAAAELHAVLAACCLLPPAAFLLLLPPDHRPLTTRSDILQIVLIRACLCMDVVHAYTLRYNLPTALP